jgi:UDP-N-acetylglucosamine acyltransferase
MSLHPTAIIHPDAQLGENVTVGPYAVVEGAAQIGDGCVIQAHAIIGAHVVMGKENTVGYGAVVGGDPQDFAFNPAVKSEVRIGDRNKIREHCTIHRGTTEGSVTVLGDDCFLMAGAHMAHNCQVGSNVVIANNALLAGHVIVGDRVFIGGGAVFHQFVRVGQFVICQGISGYGKDIPPYTIGAEVNGIAGLNVIGLRRGGFTPAQRTEIKAAFHLLYRSGLNTTQALVAAQEKQWGEAAQVFWDFVAGAKKRGLCDLIATRTGSPSVESEG